jgi:hypothetical protein
MMGRRFDVVIYSDRDWHWVLRRVPQQRAFDVAWRCIDVLGEAGAIDKVLVAAREGDAALLWERGKGVVYPEVN